MNDIILNKKENIERCVKQIYRYYDLTSEKSFEEDYLKQDAIALNLQRACEQAIHLANYVIKTKKLGLIQKYGYRFIAQFELSNILWQDEYFTPLEQLIQEFRHRYPNDSKLSYELDKDQIEIDKCNSNNIVISSFFAIIQKM